MYAVYLSIQQREKTVRILGTWRQYLVNVSGLRYSKQIEFQEELRGSLPKSGPLDFATKNTFPLFFVGEEALVDVY